MTYHFTYDQVRAIDEVQDRFGDVFNVPTVTNPAAMKNVADQMTDDPTSRAFGLKWEFDGEHIILAL